MNIVNDLPPVIWFVRATKSRISVQPWLRWNWVGSPVPKQSLFAAIFQKEIRGDSNRLGQEISWTKIGCVGFWKSGWNFESNGWNVGSWQEVNTKWVSVCVFRKKRETSLRDVHSRSVWLSGIPPMSPLNVWFQTGTFIELFLSFWMRYVSPMMFDHGDWTRKGPVKKSFRNNHLAKYLFMC